MLPLLDAEMTLPPAVVVAPSVIVYRFTTFSPQGHDAWPIGNYLSRRESVVCATSEKMQLAVLVSPELERGVPTSENYCVRSPGALVRENCIDCGTVQYHGVRRDVR